jgi:hypothetical protein
MTAGAVSFAGALLLLVPRRRRFSGIFGAVVLALLSFGSIALLTGCNNNSSSKYSGTPIGSSTITVTATSGSITTTQNIAVTVNQAQ